MTLQGPSASELQDLARSLGFGLTDAEAGEYSELLAPLVGMADAQQKMPDYLPQVKYPRTSGYRPEGEENEYNAWYYKSRIEGAADGKLTGKTVALKDNVMLAGVPMMNGTSILEGYVPEVDATIVTRLLDAGATILGKAHCENYCLSGSSHTNATGPCHNPHRMGYSAGGSSSGSAALVAAGEVDMAIGGDQGGSIRMPAAFCGVYGLKPTYGLVPYTGVLGIEAAIDHVGPMTASVADNALMLEAIAGPDGIDGRQRDVVTHPYSEMLEGGVSGLRIAVIEDGFDHPGSQAESDAVVRAACARFGELGAEIETIAFPLHREAAVMYMPALAEGLAREMMLQGGVFYGLPGLYVRGALERCNGWTERANELPPTVRVFTLLGAWYMETLGGRVYAKGMNLQRKAKDGFARLMEDFDLLLMPTVPLVAQPFPSADASIAEYCDHAWNMLANCPTYNYTGQPSMSVPCGTVDGLPVGLMITGRWWDEPTVYRAAAAFEANFDWRSL